MTSQEPWRQSKRDAEPERRGADQREEEALAVLADHARQERPQKDRLLTLELRRELAEKLSQQAIRSGRNIETIVIGSIDAAAKKWQ